MRMSAILKDPWENLRCYIQQAQLVHADETSWRLSGAQQYLWLASSALAACFRIDPHRSQQAAKEAAGCGRGALPAATGHCLFSGLRLGELLGLRWKDIDFGAEVIRVRTQLDRQGEHAALKQPKSACDVVLMPSLAKRLKPHRLASTYSLDVYAHLFEAEEQARKTREGLEQRYGALL